MQVPLRAGLTRTQSATADAAGEAVVTIAPTSSAAWVVRQVTVEAAAAPVGATCDVRLNGTLVAPVIPTGDVAAGEPPVTVAVGDELAVTWLGLDPGQVGTVLVIYDEVVAG